MQKVSDTSWITSEIPKWEIPIIIKSDQIKAKIQRKRIYIKMFIRKVRSNKLPAIYKLLSRCSASQEIHIVQYATKKDMVQSYYDNRGLNLYTGTFCKMSKDVYKSLRQYKIVKIWADKSVLNIGVMLK
jgi:hypothetical protein